MVSELARLLLEDNVDKNDEEKKNEEQHASRAEKRQVLAVTKPHGIRIRHRMSSRPGFKLQNPDMRRFFLKCKMETKLFYMSCAIRFVITHEGRNYERHVYPLDCMGDFAHFRFKSCTRTPVRLRIWQRNPDGVNYVSDIQETKEYIGIINIHGKNVPRGVRKPFQLYFLPWRPRFLTVISWHNSIDPRLEYYSR